MPSVALVLGVLRQPRAYASLAYALCALPLGLAYFALLGAGLTIGLAFLPVLLGVPLLAANAALWWWLGSFERWLGTWWLRPHPALSPPVPPRPRAGRPWLTPWRWLVAYVVSAQSWKALAYLALRPAVGLAAFLLLGSLAAVAASLLGAPVALAIAVAQSELRPWEAALLSPPLVAGGVLVLAATLHLANRAARAQQTLTRWLLS